MIKRFLAAGLAVLAVCNLHAATVVPLVNLVDDRTALALSITDAPALVRGWDASPIAKTWADEQVTKFFAPLREKMTIDEWDPETKEATGCTVRELLALADGEVLLAVPAMDFDQLKKSDEPPFLLAIHVGDQAAKIEKIMADATAKSEVTEQTEVFSGATVHIRPLKAAKNDESDAKPRTFAWAIVDGVWLVSAEKERVFSAVDALKNGGMEAALGKSVRFLGVRERVGDAQALLYLNLAVIYPVVRDAMAARKVPANKPNPMGVDPDAVFNALGLDALGEVYGAINIGEKDMRVDFGLTYTEERGLLKLAAYQPGPSPQPAWVPAKWPSVTAMQFSVPEAYAGLEQLLNAISPMLSGMAQGKITEINRKQGIDLKRDLIGSLGNEIVSAYALPPGLDAGVTPPWDRMDQLLSISLNNVEAFTKAIEGLKQMAGGPAADKLFVKRDYLGQTIYTLTPPARPGAKPRRGLSYAIANNTVLIGVGSPATVENALQGMRDGGDLFWKRDDIKTVLPGIPPEASSMQFTDLRVVIASLFETASRSQGPDAKAKPDEDSPLLVDVSAKPDAEVIGRYWGMASSYTLKTANGIFFTSRLAYPEQ
ncbi:MAG: hypothetical protein WC661_13930 [Opitutaceae bacterium]|jgi:hypothetical protein